MNATNELFGTQTIKYSMNGIVHNWDKLSNLSEQFIICDENTAIICEKGAIYLQKNTENGKMKLCDGEILGFYNRHLYYTNKTVLYEINIDTKVKKTITIWDTLLASYYDGIIYKKDGCTYSLLFETPSTPQLLIDKEITWPKADRWNEGFLYTNDKILRITSKGIEVYFLATEKIERIYEPKMDSCALQIAAVVHENTMYVSIQRTDIKNWPIRDKDINGLYRYDFVTKEWKKIGSKTYGSLMQFDELNLYGTNDDRLIKRNDIERIPLG